MLGPEHAIEAERIMGLAHNNADQQNWERATHQMQRAQLHATLALTASIVEFPGAIGGNPNIGQWAEAFATSSDVPIPGAGA